MLRAVLAVLSLLLDWDLGEVMAAIEGRLVRLSLVSSFGRLVFFPSSLMLVVGSEARGTVCGGEDAPPVGKAQELIAGEAAEQAGSSGCSLEFMDEGLEELPEASETSEGGREGKALLCQQNITVRHSLLTRDNKVELTSVVPVWRASEHKKADGC